MAKRHAVVECQRSRMYLPRTEYSCQASKNALSSSHYRRRHGDAAALFDEAEV